MPPRPEPTRRQRILRCVRNPFYASQQVFRPSRPDRLVDPRVGRLQLWRTLLGIAAWLWFTITYGLVSDAGDAEAAISDRFNQSWISVLVLMCTFPVVVGAFVVAARGPLKRLYLRRSLRSLGAIVALMASMAMFPLAVAQDPVTQGFRDFIGIPGKVVLGVLCLWSLGFALYGIGLSLVHVLRTADIHELVPPCLALVLSWEMALIDLITGAYPQVPLIARVVFIVGAPAVITAMSVWEIRRLHGHGLTLREALRPSTP
ncbi:hypothetical protein ACIQAC_31110 [Streptomyces sp. NPDC088387]|uniref:hypothetical protein n=1 Tax=Streptomyces sp. NPDC088387 TaxID=3365859 RepID=UPI00381261C5